MLINAAKIISEQEAAAAAQMQNAFAIASTEEMPTVGCAHNVQDCASAIATKKLVHFYSDGAWSMHQLLVALLGITGKATVFISSYAMSETAVRTIRSMQDAEAISQLYCVIDNRVETRSAGSLQLLKNICNGIKLTPCHAKATVLMGEHCNITVVGSANYTENKRIEIGLIMRDDDTCNFHKNWITKALRDG